MNKLKFIFSFLILALAVSCAQFKTAVETVTGNQPAKLKAPITNLSRNVKNASSDAHIEDETAIIVSALSGRRFYIGEEQYPLEELGYQISKLLEKNPKEKELVYVNTDALTEYGEAVKILDILRKSGVENVGLRVEPGDQKTAESFYYILKAKIPAEPKDDPTPVKPNPYTLVIELNKAGKINLNKEGMTATQIAQKLTEIFKYRESEGLFREGTNEVEKTVTVKAPRSVTCLEVILLLDAATGAGASPVYLQIDDLEL